MKLGDVIELGKSKKLHIVNSHEYTIAGVQSYGLGVINRRKELGKDLTMKEYQLIEKDFLMWCKVDTKNGAFGVTRDEHVGSLASTNMCLAKIDKTKIFPDFLETLFRFQFFHSYITHLSSGTTNRKYLTPSQLCELVDLPDLSLEQQREFLDLAINLNENSLEREITHQLDLVKQLRQAFLREAMQGKLISSPPVSGGVSEGQGGSPTPPSAGHLPLSGEENASILLQKIKAEKAQLIKEGKLKKEKELPPIKPEEIPFEIPKNWVWCRLGEVVDFVSGSNFNSTDFKKGEGIKCIKITNAGVAEFIETDDVLPKIFKEKFRSYLVFEGDLVLALTRPYISDGLKISQCPSSYHESLLNQRVAVLRGKGRISRHFIYAFMRSEFVLNVYKSKFDGKGQQPNLKKEHVTELMFPLPPLSEQHRIVAKLEQLMRHCDELEQSIKQSQTQNEQLLQQVLREALSPKGKEYKMKDEMSLAAEGE